MYREHSGQTYIIIINVSKESKVTWRNLTVFFKRKICDDKNYEVVRAKVIKQVQKSAYIINVASFFLLLVQHECTLCTLSTVQ